MVKTVKAWDSHLLHGDTVEFGDELVISFRRLRDIARSVEHRADLVCPDDGITCRGDVKAIGDCCRRNLGHLADLLFKGHAFEDLLDLSLDLLVLRNGRFCLRSTA